MLEKAAKHVRSKRPCGQPALRQFALAVAVATFVTSARAADAPIPSSTAVSSLPPAPPLPMPSPPSTMRVNLPLDLGITLGAGALALTLELLSPTLAPSSCRWCDRAADGTDTLNGFDASVRSALRWNNTQRADILSSVFSFGLAPMAGLGVGAIIAAHDGRLAELPEDTLVVAESAAIALNVDSIAKLAFARQRPDVHARSPADRLALQATGDNLSFFSGHTALAFALATSAGTVASMRLHRLAPVMWVSGLLLATTSGYLRIAADRHYATDVIAGAIVGSAVGFTVPYFGHRPHDYHAAVAVVPVQGGSAIMVSGSW